MGKNKKSSVPPEEHMLLPAHPSRPDSSQLPIVDTHTHLVSTFSLYRSKYKTGKHETIYDFVRELYRDHNVEAIVDVWCEAPVQRVWKSIADSALTEQERRDSWGGLQYYFVMASQYTDAVENEIIDAMAHPRCVGWGEIGLDYHYDNSPRDIQQAVFIRQLQHAVRLASRLPSTHEKPRKTPSASSKSMFQRSTRCIHIHCYTDSPEWAARMLDHFPNLFIGITGVITYSTNLNTSAVIRQMSAQGPSALRIVLETDAPFMVPSNLYGALTNVKGRLPFCHSAMVPWTAEFVADVARQTGAEPERWTTESVLRDARENARRMYGV
ncbi:hypothetical protein B0H21DRAFT_781442 [Amylocystis lapponica]|nr:hypothetical protein B0H21DRAFT_781442 [Amylocystis lapponica]